MTKRSGTLVITNLSKWYRSESESIHVLEKINLQVGAGELVAIIGPSGCGKTTLLNCIAGLTDFENGSMQVDKPSYMMQEDGLLPWRDVIGNVVLPLELGGVHAEKARKLATAILRRFGLLKFSNYYPAKLSGGMKQRVALARTYLVDCEVVLMDEPFSRLDALTKTKLQLWFLNIWQKNRKTVLFVTHDIDEAILLADRVYVLSVRPARVIGEYNISLPRPRVINSATTGQFTSLKKKLLQDLKIR